MQMEEAHDTEWVGTNPIATTFLDFYDPSFALVAIHRYVTHCLDDHTV